MFSKVKIILGISLLGALLVVAGACSETAGNAGQFEDMKWVLESYGDANNPQVIIGGSRITATFESAENQISGSAGCNTYFGDYQVNGDQLSIMHVANTEMACLEPEGVMEQESEYLGILVDVSGYEIRDGQLRLSAGSQVLVFNAE